MGRQLSPELAAQIAYNSHDSASKLLEKFDASAPPLDDLMNDSQLRHSTGRERVQLVEDVQHTADFLELASTVCARHRLGSTALISEPVVMNNRPL